jgi:hypothetical protein
MEYGVVHPDDFGVPVKVPFRLRRRAAGRPVGFRLGDDAVSRGTPFLDNVGVYLVFVSVRVRAIDCMRDIVIGRALEGYAGGGRPLVSFDEIDFGFQLERNVVESGRPWPSGPLLWTMPMS